MKRQFGRDTLVVEADIKGFVDNLEHAWVMRRVGERIEEGAFLRLLRTWLGAGVLATDGQGLPPGTGTPHGGIISPLLAKVSRHEALDRWFHQVVKPRGGGEACLIRDADDGVGAFHEQADAERFSRELGPRLGKVGLERSPDKRRVLPCTRQQGPGHPSVDCLGVECRWGRDRAGKPPLKRRTSRKKRRHSLTRVTDWCQEKGRSRRKDLFREVNAKWRGDDHDDGVNGNAARRHEFCTWVRRIRFTWRKRRRQRRSDTWTGVRDLWRHCRGERPHRVGRPPPRLAAGRAEAGLRKRGFLKSPVRENRTPGSGRGRSGNWPSYRDDSGPSRVGGIPHQCQGSRDSVG
jgi:RNA-directed DNA polymerase